MEEGNGLERWRGKTDARLDDVECSASRLWAWKDHHEVEVSEIKTGMLQRLAVLETKVAGFAAVGAAAGAVVATLIQWLLK